jgi:hypothetical protein
VTSEDADEFLSSVAGGADDADLGQVWGHGLRVWRREMTK